MSSQARTHRVQRMQSDMSCWIITSPGRVVAAAEAERLLGGDGHVVLLHVRLELVARRSARPPFPRRCSSGIPLEQHAEHAAAVVRRRRRSPFRPPCRRRRAWRRRAAACPVPRRRRGRCGSCRRWGAWDTSRAWGSRRRRARRVEDRGAGFERSRGTVERKSRHSSRFCGRRGVISSSLDPFGSTGKAQKYKHPRTEVRGRLGEPTCRPARGRSGRVLGRHALMPVFVARFLVRGPRYAPTGRAPGASTLRGMTMPTAEVWTG